MTARPRPWRPLLSSWRRSLSIRVVATTFLVTFGAVLLFGLVVVHQVTSGLLGARLRSAEAAVAAGVSTASGEFAALDQTAAASVNQTTQTVAGLLQSRGGPSGVYYVVLRSRPGSGYGSYYPPGVGTGNVPASLARRVAASHDTELYEYTTLHINGSSEPGLVVGAVVDYGGVGPPFQLYYLFPLNQEAATTSLVGRTVLFAGAALVLLVVGVVALVTRQVVSPVRQAAQTAARLASGWMEERMPVRGEDDLARLATSFNDMAAALQEQIRRLQDLSSVQRQFVADVSHELRTPLTTVRMAADLLFEARGVFDAQVSRAAELLQNQLDRFEALLADLLEISRHDAGAVLLETEPVDLRRLVESAVDSIEPLAGRRGSPVHVTLPDAPVVADVDTRRIDRVLRNLLCNAVEHGEGRPIDVGLRVEGGAVSVQVRDHGVGLRPGESALVFNRFWRADPARARTTGGTGLGLAIALEDTRLHGGVLTVTGRPGQGCTFQLTLPLPPTPPARPVAEPPAALPAARTGPAARG